MTLLRGHFAMMLISQGTASAAEIESALAPMAANGALSVAVREVPEETVPPTEGSSWVLTVHGGDRPGIVSSVAAEVAAFGGNITDLSTRLAGELYILVAEVDLPTSVDVDEMKHTLFKVAEQLDVGVSMHQVDADDL